MAYEINREYQQTHMPILSLSLSLSLSHTHTHTHTLHSSIYQRMSEAAVRCLTRKAIATLGGLVLARRMSRHNVDKRNERHLKRVHGHEYRPGVAGTRAGRPGRMHGCSHELLISV